MARRGLKRGLIAAAALVAIVGAYFLFQAQKFRVLTDSVASYEATDSTPDAGLSNVADGVSAHLLSAFHGLDALPRLANLICKGGQGLGGMPAIFSSEIDLATMQAGDFEVTTQSGRRGGLHCVSLLPAVDPGELRTVLLIGDLGPSESDPPVSVEIVGHLHSMDGLRDFRGETVAVTPLIAGPALAFAEVVADWTKQGDLGPERARGTLCPNEDTVQAVRVTWQGGVVLENGDELGQAQFGLYKITVESQDGTRSEVTPFHVADLHDGDNNHMLCLETGDRPISVSFPEGILIDPNGDLNPATSIAVK